MGAGQSNNSPHKEVEVNLAAGVFLPGNLIQGSVSLNYGRQVSLQQLGVLFTCELHQYWTTTHTSGSGKRKRRHTRHHSKTTPLMKLTIEIPHHGTAEHGQQFPFTYVLDPRSLPSIEHVEKCKLRYFFQGVYSGPDTAEKNYQLGSQTPFRVLMPMSNTMHSQVSAKSETREMDVVGCCCCDKGKCKATFSMSKTIIALDRDSIGVQVEIDNTASDADCEGVSCSLSCSGDVKIGHRCSFGHLAGYVRIAADVKAGESKIVQGVIQLDPLHPPSFSSSVVDVTYRVSGMLHMSWASDVSAAFPVFVAHTVDMTNTLMQFQQAFDTFQPIEPNAMPAMYQPPVQANAAFDMPAPPMYEALPRVQFAEMKRDGSDSDSDSDATSSPRGGGGSPVLVAGGGSPQPTTMAEYAGGGGGGGQQMMHLQMQMQQHQQPFGSPAVSYAGQPQAYGVAAQAPAAPQQRGGYYDAPQQQSVKLNMLARKSTGNAAPAAACAIA